LIIDGHTLYESVAIFHYLEATHPEPAMVPSNPLDAAKMWEITYTCHAGIQPTQNLPLLNKIDSLGGDKMEWARNAIADGFRAVETVMADTAGSCCIGDQVTIADAVLVAQHYNAVRFNVDMSQYPTIERVVTALKAREEFVAAHPDN
jgi:maleylacetoacetate isomerase